MTEFRDPRGSFNDTSNNKFTATFS